ncbi:RNA polymerase sigma factor [Tenacibaculum geojense]|uniref:RNA polymerase sigma factor n=1 Tax=Tenacibaculum geojense TaxID=915352 RepID=A0ABW3JQP7_9FLAO
MKPIKQIHNKLIQKCKKHNEKAQLQLYKAYCNAMYAVACRYMKDSVLAEDVMQDAFVKAFKSIHTYKEEVAFGAWLKRIVINTCIDELKKNKPVLVAINEEVITDEVLEDNSWQVDEAVTVSMIKKAIDNLPPKYSVVLNLYLIEGYDHNEIAEIINITPVTSRTQLLRGKKIIKETLKTLSYAEGC